MEQIKAEDPRRRGHSTTRIPRNLETIVLKAIDKDPKSRYPTAEALAKDRQRLIDDEPIWHAASGPFRERRALVPAAIPAGPRCGAG